MRKLGPSTPSDARELVDRGYVDGIVSSGTTYYQPIAAPQSFTYAGNSTFTLASAAGLILSVTLNGQTLQTSEYSLASSTTVTVTPADAGLVSGDQIVIVYALNATFTGSSTTDLEFTDAARGVILRSPNGTRYRITVSNGGSLTTAVVS